MSEEIMKVLSMLDEGKISADEAEKLIDVLSPTRGRRPPRPPKMPAEFVEKLERIPEIISTKLEELNIDKEMARVKKEFFGQNDQTKFEDVTKVVINQNDGDITVTGMDKTYTVLTAEGRRPNVVRSKASLVINHQNGGLNVLPPREARLVINSMRGDGKVSGMTQGFVAQMFTGDFNGTLDGGKAVMNVYSGDIDLVIRKNTKSKIISYSGDVNLSVAPGLDIEIISDQQSGDFRNDTDIQEDELGKGRHRMMFGDGTYKVLIRSLSGDVSIADYDGQPTKSGEEETVTEGES